MLYVMFHPYDVPFTELAKQLLGVSDMGSMDSAVLTSKVQQLQQMDPTELQRKIASIQQVSGWTVRVCVIRSIVSCTYAVDRRLMRSPRRLECC